MANAEVALNSLVTVLLTNAYIGVCEADDLIAACTALEKQIPKEPTHVSYGMEKHPDGFVWIEKDGYCVNCRHELKGDWRYCPKCGQAIDWESVINGLVRALEVESD